jgi:heme-degrading monooxygenase HmoA
MDVSASQRRFTSTSVVWNLSYSRRVPAMPWRRLRDAEPDAEIVLWVTYIPVRRRLRTPQFLSAVRRIRKQLDGTEGLFGYSLRAKPFRSDYWTLSAWESDEAARTFSGTEPHQGVAQQIMRFAPSGFTTHRWTGLGRDLPPSWDDALARLAAATTSAR